jgi:hypothetical protein
MRAQTLIESTTAAANALLIIDNQNLNGSISIVGLVTTESVAIQIPRVATPARDTDTDWTNYVYDGTTYVLNVNNNRVSLPFRGTYRIVKAESVGNAFGIKFE